jgi:hypothetical protein
MNIIIKSGIAVLALAGTTLPTMAEDIYFTLINSASRSLQYFYVAPVNDRYWSHDLLGSDQTLAPGYQSTVIIADGSTACLYDFKMIMTGGTEIVVSNINICDLNSYTLY